LEIPFADAESKGGHRQGRLVKSPCRKWHSLRMLYTREVVTENQGATLRPATTNDRAFVEQVYFQTQRWIIERLFGWRGGEIERAKLADFYDQTNSSIIVLDGADVGWVTLVRGKDGLELEGIYLAAEHQRRGVGTNLIRRFIAEADRAGVAIKLSTAKINPAQELYKRLGFVDVRADQFKVYMEKSPRKTLVIHKPSHELVPSFVRMRDAHTSIGENEWIYRGEEIAHSDPHAYVDLMTDRAYGRNIPKGWVRTDEFWIVESGEVVGMLSVRPELNDWLRTIGGHIGYAIHPQHRRRGLATFALKNGLQILGYLGVDEALVTCRPDNVASIRVIEKCGGCRIEDASILDRPELNGRRRYLVPTRQPLVRTSEPAVIKKGYQFVGHSGVEPETSCLRQHAP
jgi:predicted acetyltransferase/N-acetylglutamate synthase-like GNAT family acetyltransferase